MRAGLLRTPAALGSTMRLIDVPTAFVLQVAFFDQQPRLSSVAGALLIMLCTFGSAYRKWRQGRPPMRAISVRQSFAFGKLREEEAAQRTTRPVGAHELALASDAPNPSSAADLSTERPAQTRQARRTRRDETGTSTGASALG